MSNGHLSPLLGFLRRVSVPASESLLSDAQLLRRFSGGGDQAAFSLLLQRHGPMVHGVCRRVLNDSHDIEDAFQATFLVLVRKADRLRHPEQLGSWLYGVAYRVALKARAGAIRRRTREKQVTPMPPARLDPDPVWSDLRPLLDAEVNQLPARYRAAFVLCCLEGKTREQAAEELGIPEGTVASRLARARERLRGRLERRGIVLSAAALLLVVEANARATVPLSLFQVTLQLAGEATAAGVVSVQVMALTKGVLQAMFWSKMKPVLGIVLGLSVVGLGVGAGYHPATGGPPEEDDTPALAPRSQPQPRPQRSPVDRTNLQDDTPGERHAATRPSLLGEWVAVYAEQRGQEDRNIVQSKLRWVFERENKLAWTSNNNNGSNRAFEYRVQPLTSPKTLEIHRRDGPDMRGIYELQDDRLLVSLSYRPNPSSARPNSFRTDAGDNIVILFRRPDAPTSFSSKTRTRLAQENQDLQARVDQAGNEYETMRKKLDSLRKQQAAEKAAREAARARAEAETAKLTVENMRLRARLRQLTRQLKHLQREEQELTPDEGRPRSGDSD